MPRARRIRLLALLAALAAAPLALAACTTPVPASAPSVAPAAWPWRSSRAGSTWSGIASSCDSRTPATDPLTIEGFVVETPSLEPGLERTKPFELTPGDAIAIRLDLPASRCDAEPGPVVVRFDARTASGSDEAGRTRRRRPVRHGGPRQRGGLPGRVGRRCRDAIVMPEHLRSTGAGADRRAFIDVAIEPVASGDASMHIARVYGTTLLNAEDGIDWTLDLDVAAGEPRSVISLPVRPARCDAHAIADDKRGTILPFEIETADGRAGRLDVPASDGLKAELYAYYGERCGLQ